jgi:hypothetical protein
MIWRHVSVDGGVLGVSGNVRWVSADLVLQIGQVCIDFLERSNLALDHFVLSLSRIVLCLLLQHFLIAPGGQHIRSTPHKLKLYLPRPPSPSERLGASLPAAAPLSSV